MKNLVTSGGQLKSVDFSGVRDSWDFVEMMKGEKSEDTYAKVAAVYRAMNLTADATANIPFAVTDMSGNTDLDTSENWKNKIGIMPRPREIIRQWRLSLFQSNMAYGRVAKTNIAKKQLFYVVPASIEILTDNKTGELKGYARKVNGVVAETYKPDDKNLVKLWRLDHTTELLPSENTEFQALANSAGILLAADWWTKNYFKNGAVRPTVISVKGMVINDKKEEMQKSWAQFVRGVARGFSDLAKIINGEAMDVKQIGDGLGDVKDSPVYKQAIENVTMAAGMPLSLLLANSANYATAQTEYAAWFRDSITPWAYWMQEGMNEQIFHPANMHFEFRPEQSEPSQEEEVQRASAFAAYVGTGIKPSIAAQIVGVDLPAGIKYKNLDTEEKPEEVKPEPEPEEYTEKMPAKAWEELDIWKRKAQRNHKRGQTVSFAFETKHIPADVANEIRGKLAQAQDAEAVKAAFVIGEIAHNDDTEIKALAEAINKAAAQPTINVTVNVPEKVQ